MFYELNNDTMVNLNRINYVRFEELEQGYRAHIYLIDDVFFVDLTPSETEWFKLKLHQMEK